MNDIDEEDFCNIFFLHFGSHFGDVNFRGFTEPYYFPVGFFGFVVTFGLFFMDFEAYSAANLL